MTAQTTICTLKQKFNNVSEWEIRTLLVRKVMKYWWALFAISDYCPACLVYLVNYYENSSARLYFCCICSS